MNEVWVGFLDLLAQPCEWAGIDTKNVVGGLLALAGLVMAKYGPRLAVGAAKQSVRPLAWLRFRPGIVATEMLESLNSEHPIRDGKLLAAGGTLFTFHQDDGVVDRIDAVCINCSDCWTLLTTREKKRVLKKVAAVVADIEARERQALLDLTCEAIRAARETGQSLVQMADKAGWVSNRAVVEKSLARIEKSAGTGTAIPATNNKK